MTNPITTLQAWLQEPVYTEGVRLYEQLIGPGFLLSMLKLGVDDDNRSRLSAALTQKLSELEAAEAVRKASYPDPLVAELGTGGLLMDERTLLKERMRVLYNSGISESEELKQMAFRMLTIKDSLDGIYGRKHFFDQHGFLPDAASLLPEAITPADLLRRRASVRTYVSKYTRQLEQTYQPQKRRKLQAKLDQFQTELHELDNQITHLSPPVA